jgi:hypothetical protein
LDHGSRDKQRKKELQDDSALNFTKHHGPRVDKSKRENVLKETTINDASANKSTSYHPEYKKNVSTKSKNLDKTEYEEAQSFESVDSFTLLQPQAASSPVKIAKYPHKNVTEKTPLKNSLESSKVYADPRRDQATFSRDVRKNLDNSKRPENLQTIYYKTSIEKWKPVGDKKIHCPRCQAFKRPIVKAHKEHTTDSSVLSAFLAACFPLYCSPCCLIPTPKFEYLHCPICDFHLGIYDHDKNIVFPNPHVEREL